MGCGASKSSSPIQPLKSEAPSVQDNAAQTASSVQKAPTSNEHKIPDQKKSENATSNLQPKQQIDLQSDTVSIESVSPAPIVESNSNPNGSIGMHQCEFRFVITVVSKPPASSQDISLLIFIVQE